MVGQGVCFLPRGAVPFWRPGGSLGRGDKLADPGSLDEPPDGEWGPSSKTFLQLTVGPVCPAPSGRLSGPLRVGGWEG